MNIETKINTLNKVFIDTAPIIYFVERNPTFFSLVKPVFDNIDQGKLLAVTSPITLAESLIFPIRLNQPQLIQGFCDLVVHANNTSFVNINDSIGIKAAELRVQYNLTLTDALQIAVALAANCDGFLTNDMQLKKVSEVDIVVLQEYSI